MLMEAGRKRGASGNAVPPPLPPNLEAVVAVMADAAAAAADDAAPAEKPSLCKKANTAGDDWQGKTSK